MKLSGCSLIFNKEKFLFTFPALENGIREKKIRELHILYDKKMADGVFMGVFYIETTL